jgi:hypothetical protein
MHLIAILQSVHCARSYQFVKKLNILVGVKIIVSAIVETGLTIIVCSTVASDLLLSVTRKACATNPIMNNVRSLLSEFQVARDCWVIVHRIVR